MLIPTFPRSYVDIYLVVFHVLGSNKLNKNRKGA